LCSRDKLDVLATLRIVFRSARKKGALWLGRPIRILQSYHFAALDSEMRSTSIGDG
jgi:hypothetical protein